MVVLAQIVADRRLAAGERTPLRRTRIGARDGMTDDALLPAASGFDEKIVLLGAVWAHFGERHTQACGADLRRLGQNLQQVGLAKGKAAEAGNRRLLAEKRRKMLRQSLKSLGVDTEALLAATGIAATARAEELGVEQFCALARAFGR
jgi:hypothetical protein